MGTWETLYNPDFKVVEFDHFKTQAGLPTFTLSTKQWVEQTNAIGIYVQAGRYGGTYAHKDIAFEFGSAISPVFKLYLIKEYQRLKDIENDQSKLEWSAKCFLSKANHRIHTDAVKNYVLSNLETHNAELIKSGQTKQERFEILPQIARYQIAVLDEAEKMKALKNAQYHLEY